MYLIENLLLQQVAYTID